MRSRTYIAVPPGATIREQLKEKGMSQKEFALRMDMSQKHISRLVNGDVLLTAETALRLETVLGVPAQFWNNLESVYREKLIRAEAENALEEDAEIAEKLPYSEMAELGWVEKTENRNGMITNLRKYFGVVKLSLLGEKQISGVIGRNLSVSSGKDLAAMAWIRQCSLKANGIKVPKFTPAAPEVCLERIRQLTAGKAQNLLQLSDVLAECGIILAVEPLLKCSSLASASFISGNRAVICMSDEDTSGSSFRERLFLELAYLSSAGKQN